ncbi:MAG: ergothioneine biosynthesis protein EgtB [Chitinophagaceae bacterium]|nr:MAG: ergothioneine biosynthesis protein EgtB [Chitinophagaceae bacterium]
MELETINKPEEKDRTLHARYRTVRERSVAICAPLATEDYVVQPVADVSPPKWHLGHTTWFFETFVLLPNLPDYKVFDQQYNFVFNSYYETIGARVIRTDRGNLSRPSVADVYHYREYVEREMSFLLKSPHVSTDALVLLELGLNHEQQHQELLISDIKYILGHNPLLPAIGQNILEGMPAFRGGGKMIGVEEGIFGIGHVGDQFSFDNESGRHKVYLNAFQISDCLVTNGEYLDFIGDGGYRDFRYWHAEGWEWVNKQQVKAPLYWHNIDGVWMHYTLDGLAEIGLQDEVCHISFYEASAFAAWAGKRLPTEFEWEAASGHFDWGSRWEWTNSAYLPYPGFRKEAGAVGEYNGKFMINQMVLRGASVATPRGHSRHTYRNFFHPPLRWQFTGIRLAK